ncbi:MAG: CoA-transferase [Dehalococcoidia bacterium]
MKLSAGLTPELIAIRIAHEIEDGMVVNIGVGIGVLVSDFVPPEKEILFHAEHGMVGFGPSIEGRGEEYFDPDCVVFGRYHQLLPGASVVDHAESFAIVRGGHLDLAVLGAFEVSATGDLANWTMPHMASGGIGGGPDIASSAKRVIVAMEHLTRDGRPRLVERCSLPLTAPECVHMVVTNCGVFEPGPEGLILKEIAPGLTVEEVQAHTDAHLVIAEDLREVTI